MLFYNSFFFTTYIYKVKKHVDNSSGITCHYIGRMQKGSGRIVTDNGTELQLNSGDVFYLPQGLRYHSYWFPSKRDEYVVLESYRFTYFPCKSGKRYILQKIYPNETAVNTLDRLAAEKTVRCSSIGLLYAFLGEVFPSMTAADSNPQKLLLSKARHYIFFVPENVEPVSDVHEDVTLTGYYYDEKLYYGVTDNVLANSKMNNLISSSFIMQGDRTLVGTDGISYVQNNTIGKNTYEVGEGSSMNYCEEIPGVTPQTYHTKALITHHFLLPVEGKTYCELPIPEPGQTLTGEWKIFDAAGVTFTITKITRENSKTITFTTSDTQHRTFDSSEKPSEDFSDAVRSIFLCEQIFIGTEDATCSMKAHETEEGYYYRYSAKSFKEYCKTHDTIPFGIDYIEVHYSGDWTLTFPEN